jgi:lysylphosphatidylglycerol synthetase-like protein (DUF2156 family)
MKVTAPDGTRWKVRRRWLGKRFKVGKPDGFDGGSGLDFGDADGILAVIAAILLVVVLFFLAWFVIAIALEITILIVLLVAGLFGRVVLRKPWTVVAVNEHDGRRQWQVVGWRASRALIRDVEAALQAGMPLPDQSQ